MSNTQTIDPVLLDKMMREADMLFAETRASIEREINQFYNSLANLDPDIQQQINYNPECNARTVVPALWSDPFDKALYEQQLNNFRAYEAQVLAIIDGLNREAVTCLQALQSAR